MSKQYNADVAIVGAGPVGSYLAWKLADIGLKIVVVDAQPLDQIGQSIEIFHMDVIRFDEFGIPHPQGKELLHREDSFRQWFPDLSSFYTVDYPFYVLHMPSYIQRLHEYCKSAGVTLLEQTPVKQLFFDQGALTGFAGDDFEVHAKLVVDASGIKAAVRTHLPDSFGVENTAVPPEQTFFCCLELRDDLPDDCPKGNNGYAHAPVFWNRSYGDGAVLGVIMPGSIDLAWQVHTAWREASFGSPGTLVATKEGCAPYRRPPYSLVGNGFLGVGDAVYQNKAFSGEGVTSAYTACAIAADVIRQAVANQDCSREALWQYNSRYFHGQGASFAGTMAFFPMLSGLPMDDLNYLYKNGIFYNPKDMETLNREYELVFDEPAWDAVRAKLLQGMSAKQFSLESIGTLEKAHQASLWIKQHYLEYPDTPDGWDEWAATARQFWGY